MFHYRSPEAVQFFVYLQGNGTLPLTKNVVPPLFLAEEHNSYLDVIKFLVENSLELFKSENNNDDSKKRKARPTTIILLMQLPRLLPARSDQGPIQKFRVVEAFPE
jgi:hypothetical protein